MSLRLPPPLDTPAERGARRRARGAARRRRARRRGRAHRAAARRARRDLARRGRRGVRGRARSLVSAPTPSPPASSAAPTASRATACASSRGRSTAGCSRVGLDARRVARRRLRATCGPSASGRRSTAPPARRWPTSPTGRRWCWPGSPRGSACPVDRRRAARDRLLAARDRRAQAPRRLRAVRLRRAAAVRLAGALDRAAAGVICAHGLALPHLPVLRSHLRTRGGDGGNGRWSRVRGRRAGRAQPRLHLPEGVRAQAAPRGPRPPDHAAGPARRRAGRGDLGRGLRGDRPAPVAAARRARPQRGRRLHRQPERPQPVVARVRAGLAARARAPRTSTRPRPSTRCPSRSAPG